MSETNLTKFSTDSFFEEPANHKAAREILGRDFHGVLVTEKHFGAFSEQERREKVPLCLRDHRTGQFLSEERTLSVIEECKGTHILCAMHRLNLPAVQSRRTKLFHAEPNRTWFRLNDEQMMWSGMEVRDPWVLVRKDITPDSIEKNVEQQKKHLKQQFPKERSLIPVEFAEIAIVHFLETGERLADRFVVRFFVQTVGAHWVSTRWDNGLRLHFMDWVGHATPAIGSLSARTS